MAKAFTWNRHTEDGARQKLGVGYIGILPVPVDVNLVPFPPPLTCCYALQALPYTAAVFWQHATSTGVRVRLDDKMRSKFWDSQKYVYYLPT